MENLGHEVQCGRCRACRLSRKYEWVTRLTHEANTFNWKVLYVTLTYDSQNLPENYSLCPKHLTDYFKRVRKALSKGYYRTGIDVITREPIYIYFPIVNRIKYYACGEYGEERGRPHYHALIYGLGLEHSDLLYAAWKKCETQSFKVEVPRGSDALGYVAGYTRKKLRKRYNSWYKTTYNRVPEFARQSLGIGKVWALLHSDQYKRQLSFYVNGKQRFLPRYYRKVLGIESEHLQPLIDKMLMRNDEMYRNAYLKTGKRLLYSQFMQQVREECDFRLSQLELRYNERRKGKRGISL